MTDREAFVKKLAQDEDDTQTRLVFSDWLDEHNEPDEAERMRQWPAAKAWLVQFCADHNDYDPDESYGYLSHADLLEKGRKVLTGEQDDISCGPNMDMQQALNHDNATRTQFWRCISILTGLPLPDGIAENSYFRCGC